MSSEPRTYRSPRRERDAARTREEILDAARRLFVSRGYPRVTMSDIAREAGTAVKTVYASAGTKAELLRELLRLDVAESSAPATIEELRSAPDLATATACLARGTRSDHERFGDSIDLLYASLGDEGADRIWQQVMGSYRGALREAATVLVAKGLVPEGLDTEEVSDRLWFCFGIAAWRTLLHDCGWDHGRAESWLGAQAVAALGGPESG
ncbi:helix-turn-helix domain containing protein [Nocardiopsis sp. N85]|uniref:TetR/AcrR family transcriptional regulator n=1 Tax=Nocardiopsis sp. N85 TaxID=3029400 RepID=UPI00237F1616|nr:TetR/AcrR family transcriptional regulator [Nocardiopsis sp. N85]MDE3721908.1 helix-turn-helix domain containing protein [Nocardiopsis sp. N85]